jgi:hypothetical protein
LLSAFVALEVHGLENIASGDAALVLGNKFSNGGLARSVWSPGGGSAIDLTALRRLVRIERGEFMLDGGALGTKTSFLRADVFQGLRVVVWVIFDVLEFREHAG